jgi:hypothetical protein
MRNRKRRKSDFGEKRERACCRERRKLLKKAGEAVLSRRLVQNALKWDFTGLFLIEASRQLFQKFIFTQSFASRF